MREHNLAVVLGEVVRHRTITRARLAEITGFTKTTVSNLVGVLAEAGLVREDGRVREGERGRPGVAVTISRDGAAGLGLEINVDYLAACVLDLSRRVRYRDRVVADNRGEPPERVLAELGAMAARAVAAAGHQGLTVAGAAVAVPGVLDRDRLRTAPNLGWSDVAIADLLDAHLPALRLPARLDNEANLAALGELWSGAADPGDFVYVSGEIGVGAGVVVDGRVFRGAHGSAGELGHVMVDPAGPPCPCGGHGCLEQTAGQEHILRAAGLTSVDALVARLDAGDRTAQAAVTRAGEALGAALTAAVNLLDPDTVILGGIFSPLGPWISAPVTETLATGTLRAAPPAVRTSQLAGDAAIRGAAGLVVDHVIADPAALTGLRTQNG